jgi:hypothetical protein
MNHEERQVIGDIFGRLRQVENQPRDPETERFIAERVREQPYAPYAMAQAIYVQEQALANLNAEVERLRAEVEQMRRQPQGGGGLWRASSGAAGRASRSRRVRNTVRSRARPGAVPRAAGRVRPCRAMAGSLKADLRARRWAAPGAA